MSASVPQAAVDAAKAYEALFVPALFGQWARVVAESAGIASGQRVLDVGCGTGALAREALARVAPGGQVAGIDASPGMIAVARQLAPAIAFDVASAESLPFTEQSFDAVASQFALMFFDDRPRALREMRRVLTPGGRLAIAVWDRLGSVPAYAAEVALLEASAGPRAADALRAPFVLGERDALAALFREAGIDRAAITTHRGTARFPDLRTMIEADLRGWLPVMGVALDEDVIARIVAQARVVLAPYAAADGRVTFELSAHVVAATAH